MTKKEKENQRCRERYHRLKKDPVWYAKLMERNRKNQKTKWKKIAKDPVRKENLYSKNREYQKNWAMLPQNNDKRKAWRWKLKLDCLSAYSNNLFQCKCCGENEIKFLSIDHIEGGGNKERKALGGGMASYLHLRRNNYPSGYQVLCFNCNCAKGFFGECPHKTKNLSFKEAVNLLA